MYLLFKNTEQKNIGRIHVIGTWNDAAVGEIQDNEVDSISMEYRNLKPRILESEGVAWAWMYVGASRGTISVRTGTPQNQRLQILQSEEATGEKVKYTLTDEDKANTVKFMQEVMRLWLDEIYDKRMIQFNASVSELEYATFAQQEKEARAYIADDSSSTPMLSALATARGITVLEMANKVVAAVDNHTAKLAEMLAKKQLVEADIKACASIEDCNRLLHNRFERQMPLYQSKEEGIEHSSKFDV